MEVGMSLNALVRVPVLSSASRLHHHDDDYAPLLRHSLFSSRTSLKPPLPQRHHHVFVVEAKGKKGMTSRQFQRSPPPLPKIEDDGNPKFVIFIRMANVYLWYPLSIVTGGTTAKIMVAAKDNFLGKYIYKDTLDRNLAAVIYRDEKEIQKTAFKQYRVLRSATDFRYGYKLVENANIRAALSTTDVVELPTPDKLKTVLDKVKDFFGDAKESFGKITALGSIGTEESEEDRKGDAKKEKANWCKLFIITEEKMLVVKAEKAPKKNKKKSSLQRNGQEEGNSDEDEKEEEEEQQWSAKSYGRYCSRIALLENVQFEKIKAEVSDGVLYITIPKAASHSNILDIHVQ